MELSKTVGIYLDTGKQVGDVDHLKVFANEEVTERWFVAHDPEGVAFDIRFPSERRSPHGRVSHVDVNLFVIGQVQPRGALFRE